MRPVVSTGKAWFCTILSAFGVIILTPIAHLFNTNHESFVGSINDPEDGPAVAHTVYIAALVYLVFFVFCGSQVYFASRKRSIALR
ncbi:YPR170W-B [Zygosaccharomyces parabailii]|uniref:ZYBA0S06-06634g1_1 n=1 Tax=Zygosaccharomyces bailii (strain CLIB 213 / ATCC 58445 / CBS 680 / BCRC 21525 / NBRC 1098 / NCYC 1416 / NRRL Y-2227) TaxID=1333698 RepID=A0A8J2T8Q7_ZYGB2|nr:YPR170W-B [Zygosaccharomyces parabailii]AQZ18824.1 YPR170W-B [Zygosaccharomyces parabailii]CDF90355.1 ZYBA0S06-06634g1_1 [Zygosaccharomyces bailii CLIB 213]